MTDDGTSLHSRNGSKQSRFLGGVPPEWRQPDAAASLGALLDLSLPSENKPGQPRGGGRREALGVVDIRGTEWSFFRVRLSAFTVAPQASLHAFMETTVDANPTVHGV
jgi:hypothetical protein